MASVITWRDMAGPNFAGTAAAMDAGANRIDQMANTFQQLAQDQTRIQAEAKAKRTKDNTAKVLSQLGSINDLNALNQQMPNFSFDSLRGQYGDEIDAGLIANTANKQAGVIQENQIRDMDFSIAKEKPIMGQASETIAGLLNKGDVKGAKAAYQQFAGQLTDATPLADMINKHEAEQFDRTVQNTELGFRQQQASREATLFSQQQDLLKKTNTFNEKIKVGLQDALTGKTDTVDVDITDAPDPIAAYQTLSAARQVIIDNSDLTPETKDELLRNKAIRDTNLAKAQEQLNFVINKNRETKPVVNPAEAQFYTTASPELKTAIANKAITSADALVRTLKETNPDIESESWEDMWDYGIDEIQSKLKSKGVNIEEYEPVVVAAAVQGIVVNRDNKLDSNDIDLISKRIKDFAEKQNTYKNNANAEQAFKFKKESEINQLTSLYSKKEALEQKLAKLNRRDSKSITYANLLGKGSGLRGEEIGKTEEELNSLNNNIIELEVNLGLKSKNKKSDINTTQNWKD